MKRLPQFIKESLFDTDLVTNTKDLDKAMFEDPNSDFWKFIIPNGVLQTPFNAEFLVSKSNIDINRMTIDIPYALWITGHEANPLTNEYDLRCQLFEIGRHNGMGPHPDPIKNTCGFKSITANCIQIDGLCKEIKDCDFHISEVQKGRACNVRFLFGDELKMNNVSIDFQTKDKIIACNDCTGLPSFKGLKSNVERISIYDPGIFDYAKSELDKFFGSGKITTATGVVKNKSTRNIVAIANGLAKYYTCDPVEFKPVGKIGDLFDLSGLKDLNNISISNNNVIMMFFKVDDPDVKKNIENHAKYVRMNNLRAYKDQTIPDMYNRVLETKTTDGWVVCIEKKYF